MATAKQRAAARTNIRKAAAVAKEQGTLKRLPKSVRSALGKRANQVKRQRT